MKKFISIVIFLLFIILILFNSLDIMESIRLSFSICINNLFPSLIPFMLISNILINYNFIDDLSDIFGKIMNNVFKVNKNCSFAFIMSMISGTPSNSKYLKDLMDNELITIDDCIKCMKFCHFTNPIFIIGTIGYTFLKDKKLGLIILISHYFGSILIGFFNKNKDLNNQKSIKFKRDKKSLILLLSESINNTVNTLFLILGIITTCLIITCIINKIILIDENFKFVYGLIEITQGLNYLSLSNLNIVLKAIIASFLISFGGICIHAQVFSILENKKIRYIPYLISRLVHGIISSILTYIFINLLY